MFDVCIIGAGVVGMNIARELARYQLKICVLEKAEDVGCGCSKANSGIVHGGFTDEPGTLKAELCVRGNQMYEQLENELNFGYRQTGSLVLAFDNDEITKLQELYAKGIKNGVQGLHIINKEEILAREPYVNKEVKAALYCENAGVTSPYEFVIALAENAVTNGVEIKLNSEVIQISQLDQAFQITTSQNEQIAARYVVNAAGIHSDTIARMVGIDEYQINPRRGQYIIMDKDQSFLVKSVIFQVPTKLGKGILVTTTYHGNLMIGPNAEEVMDKENVGTNEEALAYIVQTARKLVPDLSLKRALKSFAGNRPVANQEDWIIGESNVKGFINLVGIDSPGLTSSPAIALKVTGLLRKSGLSLIPKESFNPNRQPIIKKKDSSFQGDINAADPEQHIICRCEKVTEAEIIDSLHRGLPVRSIDAVARRTRAGFGTCQGNFCGPRVREIISRELNIPKEEIKDRSNAFTELIQRVKRLTILKL